MRRNTTLPPTPGSLRDVLALAGLVIGVVALIGFVGWSLWCGGWLGVSVAVLAVPTSFGVGHQIGLGSGLRKALPKIVSMDGVNS